MPVAKRILAAGIALLSSCILTSCNDSGGQPTGYYVTFSTSSLSFDQVEGSVPPGLSVTGQDHGVPDGDVYIGASVEGDVIQAPIYVELNEASGTAVANIVPRFGLSAGNYTGALSFVACADPACRRHYPGSPHTVNYTVRVHERLAATPGTVSIGVLEQATSDVTPVDLRLPTGVTRANLATSYQGASGWLQVANMGNAFTLVADAGSLAPGTYYASVNVTTAGTLAQETIVPVALTVAFDPARHLSADLSSVSFAGVETGAVPTQTLMLNRPKASSVAATIDYTGSASGWLQVQNSGGSLDLRASVAGLAPGTYEATLGLNDGTETFDVPVTFVVSKGLLPQADEAWLIDNDASGNGSFTVSALAGVTATQWSASSDQPWLLADTASGAIGGSLGLHLDPERFRALANNADHVATISVSGAGLTAISKRITVRKRWVEIAHVDALALLPGESGDVLLHGAGFAGMTGFAQRLHVGELPLQNVTVLSDTLARVTLQRVPEGNHPVYLDVGVGTAARRPVLRVLARRSFAYQAIDTAGRKGALVWDAVNQAAFAVDMTISRVHRFGWNGSAFVNTAVNVSQPYKLAIDRDHETVVLATSGGLVKRLDPVTLGELSSVSPVSVFPSIEKIFLPLAIDGSNRIWIGSTSYHLDSGLVQLPAHNHGRETAAASANGQRLLFSPSGTYSPMPGALKLDLGSGAFESLPNDGSGYFYNVASNREGTQWLLHHAVMYDHNLLKLGNLILPSRWYALNSAISRDGRRAYVFAFTEGAISTSYDSESTTADKPRVFVFDTSPLSAAQTDYTLLGHFDLQHYAGCRAFTDTCSALTAMDIADDDRTLFFAGDRKFIAAPVPANLLPPSDPESTAYAGVVARAAMARFSSPARPVMGMTLWRRPILNRQSSAH